MSIHSRIKERRIALGLTSHKALGELLGVSWQTVQLWEKEGGTAPKRERLPEVAKVLKCSTEWLATGRPDQAGDTPMPDKPKDAPSGTKQSGAASRISDRTTLHRLNPDEERLLEMYRLSYDDGQEMIMTSAENTEKRLLSGIVRDKSKGGSS